MLLQAGFHQQQPQLTHGHVADAIAGIAIAVDFQVARVSCMKAGALNSNAISALSCRLIQQPPL